ncbi:hypothetical protein CCACVL1_25978 [Corchorus capsularis]|uniref:Protein kinase domain-containing protein n=1 Tax=Corchorus capsularis TaxID=210143 RepID=A0A1R3GGE1_COCAP|nr:hypothetical protein CCACVL1_25978 [Corchorus capsularis]
MEASLGEIPFGLDFHPSKELVAVSLITGDLHLYKYKNDDSSLERLLDVRAHSESCRTVRFINGGQAVVTGSKDCSILATDVETGSVIARLENAHENAINSLINLTDSTVASGDDEGCIKVWDTRQRSCCGSFNAHEDYVSDMNFIPDSMKLLTTSGDGTLSVCNLRTYKVQTRSEFSEDELTSVVVLKLVMETKASVRFTLGKQSSMAPERNRGETDGNEKEEAAEIDGVRLMYLANEGDLDGIRELLDSGINVNFRDIDDRTALHIAACQGQTDVVSLLLQHGANVDPKDRWGSTPLADAIYYKNHDVIKLLEKHGAKSLMAPMHVNHAREVPEYEIDPKELDFTNSVDISKGTFCSALWRGTEVAVKKLGDEVLADEDKLRAFRDELALFQKIRHPNVVQFLGAVTQSSPMMIVTEYLPKGDFRLFLDRKGALKPVTAVKLALDIARGMNYLHENKPAPIIHRDLEPSDRFVDLSPNSVEALLKLDEDRLITGSENGLISLVGILPNRIIQPIAEHSDYPVEGLAFSHDRRFLGSISHDQMLKLWDLDDILQGSANATKGQATMSDSDSDEMDVDDNPSQSKKGTKVKNANKGAASNFFADL